MWVIVIQSLVDPIEFPKSLALSITLYDPESEGSNLLQCALQLRSGITTLSEDISQSGVSA